MSVTIKPNKMKYKNSSGNYVGINAIAEQTTAEEVADIQAASTAAQGEITTLTETKKTEITNKGNETLASIPQDYTSLSNEVSSLSSAINNIATLEEDTEEQTIEIQSTLTWDSGYVSNGTKTESDSYRNTSIPVQKGDLYNIYVGISNYQIRFVDQMNGASVVQAQSNQRPVTVVTGVDHIVISVQKSYVTDESFKLTRTRTVREIKYELIMDDEPNQNSVLPVKSGGIFGAIKEVSDSIPDTEQIEEEIVNLVEITTEKKEIHTTTVVSTTINDGFLYEDGTIYTGGNYDAYGYTEKIAVQEGDILSTYNIETGNMFSSFRTLVAYNGNTLVEGYSEKEEPYTVPSGVNYVAISFTPTYKSNNRIEIESISAETVPALSGRVEALEASVNNPNPNSIVFKFDLAGGNIYTDPLTRPMSDYCGYNIAFTAKIPSTLAGQIVIGKGYGLYDGAAIGIDATNVYIYVNGAEIGSPSSTYAHGLTLKDYICIEIDAGYSIYNCSARIKTNGGEYSFTPSVWRSQEGIFTVRSTLDSVADCTLSYACPALDNEIWIYGDSYTSCHNNARWAYWLVNAGHTKFLLNSDPGRSSPAAYQSFLVDLSLNKRPKKIIWLMGMNDKDGDSAPNSNWVTAVEAVEDYCEANGIELILATIPNVPSSATRNTYKNAYVVDSGYRYIDWANAVSADGSSTWYDNMLNSDNVHPDKEGAKALYSAAVTVVPELLK